MKSILLFGAGKSATVLIAHLGDYCQKNNCRFLVCDQNVQLVREKISGFSTSEAIDADVTNESQRRQFISSADLVISMLPPALHFLVAKDCVFFSKHLLTASYVDENMLSLAEEVKNRNILFLSEMGLDPGIDHMSAMRIIHDLKKSQAVIQSFYSHCGGLVAPESDDNPWHYKVTWNPANVVMAGSSGAIYRQNGKEIKIPYVQVFAQTDQSISVDNLGKLAWYANRNSLTYMSTYGLESVQNFIRTTLRYPSYNHAWNVIVHLGLTEVNDSNQIKDCHTFLDWFTLKKEKYISANGENKIVSNLNEPELKDQFNFLGLFSNDLLPVKTSSAILLQVLLEKNLVMHENDKDMIVMVHELEYEINGKQKKTVSSLVVKGTDRLHTAMAKTVGMPLATAAILILEGKIAVRGLHIPVIPEIYIPVLGELEKYGIAFQEEVIE